MEGSPVRLTVRSEALAAAAAAVDELADATRDGAHRLAAALAHAGPVRVRSAGDLVLASRWVRVDAETLAVVGPGGLWGESLALEVLAVRLRAAARAYAGVEASVSAVLAGVGAGSRPRGARRLADRRPVAADRHPGATDAGARR